MEQKKKIKISIVILAILLGLSLLALGGTVVYNKLANATPVTVTVPDNRITPDEDTTKPDDSASQAPDGSAVPPAQGTTAETKKAATIELYNKQPEENTWSTSASSICRP